MLCYRPLCNFSTVSFFLSCYKLQLCCAALGKTDKKYIFLCTQVASTVCWSYTRIESLPDVLSDYKYKYNWSSVQISHHSVQRFFGRFEKETAGAAHMSMAKLRVREPMSVTLRDRCHTPSLVSHSMALHDNCDTANARGPRLRCSPRGSHLAIFHRRGLTPPNEALRRLLSRHQAQPPESQDRVLFQLEHGDV